jgi:Pili assembly chaperone PapD, C-terminal domain
MTRTANKAGRGLAVKLIGAGACGTLLAGVGAAAALAAPGADAAKATASSGTFDVDQITNLTPYTWTFNASISSKGDIFQVAPTQTVAPGQTATWSMIPAQKGDKFLWWTFADDQGGQHGVAAQDLQDDSVFVDADDFGGGNPTESTVFHTADDPDGVPRHVDAVWNTPATITIDAGKDPAAATQIVNSELPRVQTDQISFTPNPDAKATYTYSDKTRATSTVANYSSAPATIDKGQETTKGDSTSLGEEVTAQVSSKAFGVAAKDAASFTHDQGWGTSDSVSVNIDTEIDPGQVGWIDKVITTAHLTGHLVFTTPEGTTFDITNVTISKGDLINPDGGVPAGIAFIPNEEPIVGPPAKN